MEVTTAVVRTKACLSEEEETSMLARWDELR